MAYRSYDERKKEQLILENPINYKRVVSETFQKILCNKGFNFDSEEQKILDVLHKFSRENNFKMLFPTMVQILSENGIAIPILDKTKGDHIMLTLAEPQFINKVGKLFHSPFMAVVYTKENIDDNSFIVRKEYTDKTFQMSTYLSEKNNELKLENVTAKVPNEWKSKLDPNKLVLQHHDLGCSPVGVIYNKPYWIQGFNAITQTMVQEQTDIWNARGAFELSNQVLIQTYKELLFNRTRLVGNFSQTQMNKMQQTSELGSLLGDYLIEATPEAGTSGTRNVEFLQANPVLDKYCSAYLEVFKIAMRATGISENDTQTGTQKTSGEIAMVLNNTTETLKIRRLILAEQLMSQIFDKVLTIAGIDPIDEKGQRKYNFDIVGTDMLDESKLTEILIQQIEAGLATREDAVGRIRNINSHEAEQAVKEIDTKQERDLKAMEAITGGNENGSDSITSNKDTPNSK